MGALMFCGLTIETQISGDAGSWCKALLRLNDFTFKNPFLLGIALYGAMSLLIWFVFWAVRWRRALATGSGPEPFAMLFAADLAVATGFVEPWWSSWLYRQEYVSAVVAPKAFAICAIVLMYVSFRFSMVAAQWDAMSERHGKQARERMNSAPRWRRGLFQPLKYLDPWWGGSFVVRYVIVMVHTVWFFERPLWNLFQCR
jgi:hypothetical protein